jgi:hypothetical protein
MVCFFFAFRRSSLRYFHLYVLLYTLKKKVFVIQGPALVCKEVHSTHFLKFIDRAFMHVCIKMKTHIIYLMHLFIY